MEDEEIEQKERRWRRGSQAEDPEEDEIEEVEEGRVRRRRGEERGEIRIKKEEVTITTKRHGKNKRSKRVEV